MRQALCEQTSEARAWETAIEDAWFSSLPGNPLLQRCSSAKALVDSLLNAGLSMEAATVEKAFLNVAEVAIEERQAYLAAVMLHLHHSMQYLSERVALQAIFPTGGSLSLRMRDRLLQACQHMESDQNEHHYNEALKAMKRIRRYAKES